MKITIQNLEFPSELKNKTLIALVYENTNKVYLPYNGAIISFTKYINILNSMIRK